ncbi:hypothetical protein QBC34DRAFT_334845 [Podospora aff. communis PSN243]|uniref:F-box domain-containing protein n=1 Tax=Podospora aff. communis PSN243 TaxID=3040156 RepID=A0AAV9G6M6_9PEZI|nr:hypothetical protein QBC34DRAFT_334845 [Podospora aff. communis PSN243]
MGDSPKSPDGNMPTTSSNATEPAAEPIQGSMAYVAGLNPDVWRIIVDNLDHRRDVSSLCRACKGLYPVATAALYRRLVLGPIPDEDYRSRQRNGIKTKTCAAQWADALSLVRRLVASPNPDHTHGVRELEFASLQITKYQAENEQISNDMDKEDTLAALVKVLPGLRRVQISGDSPPFEAFFRALDEHPNKPDIHLLGEKGLRPTFGPLPRILTIRASVNPWRDSPEKPNTSIPDLEKLFFSCSNLCSFSLTVGGNYGGCTRPHIHHGVTLNFQFDNGNVTFPPLESISLNGYAMGDNEWPHWRDGMQWNRLKSLSLGPNPSRSRGPSSVSLLEKFRGYATALRSLTVLCWAAEGEEKSAVLNSFLASFDTLEELVVKRHFVPAQSLVGHTNLKRLLLHCIETWRPEGEFRPTLDATDLALLDASCPGLEELEIDISRDASGQWPKPILETLATSFPNLRRLGLHCEVGIDFIGKRWPGQENPLLPLLDGAVVRTFAEPFFALRGSSKLETLTLKTGENLRRFPQWPPPYQGKERSWARTHHVFPPGSGGEVKVLKGEVVNRFEHCRP